VPTSVSLGTFVPKWEQGDMSVQSQAVGVTGRGTRPDHKQKTAVQPAPTAAAPPHPNHHIPIKTHTP
jgi:hypothetical protein